MEKELTDILACPVCKGKLGISIGEENENEVVAGYLYCSGCDIRYPIVDTIPNLLPPDEHA